MSNYKKRTRKMARNIFWDSHDKESYSCADCKRRLEEISGTFEVHHIDGNAYNNDPENLVGLCKACHAIREDRKPGADSISRILEQFSNGGAQDKQDQTAYLIASEILRGFKSVGAVESRKLGFEPEEFRNLTPRTRREAALFQRGREAECENIYLATISEHMDELKAGLECASCGTPNGGFEVLPDPEFGDLDDRHPFCYDCANDIIESSDGTPTSILESMLDVLHQNDASESLCFWCEDNKATQKLAMSDGSVVTACEDCSKDEFVESHVVFSISH